MTQTSLHNDTNVPSRSSLPLWIGTAGGVFFLLATVDSFIATPLRSISATISHFILELSSLPITRQGTILSTPELTFDVVPACSGSVTLRVLVGIGIYWCGTHPRLNLPRKIIGACLTVPIALMANGVRVALLVGASYMLNTVIEEGMLHSLIGIIGFVLGMIGFYLITESLALASPQISRTRNNYFAWGLFIIILGFMYFPFLWKAAAYYNPARGFGAYDRLGIFLVIAAVGIGVVQWLRVPADARFVRGAIVIFVFSMVLVIISLQVDITYLLGLSLLLTLFSVIYACKGRAFALISIPLLIVLYLGFPHIAMQINWLTTKLFNVATLNINMLLRFVAGIVLILIYWSLRQRVPNHDGIVTGNPKSFIHISIAMAMVILAFQGYTYSTANKTNLDAKLVFSYIQGDWIGHDLPISNSSVEYFGKGNLWSRQYTRDNHHVNILINASGGNRHRNHPPEYCLTGSGWKIDKRYKSIRQIGEEEKIKVTEMQLIKEGEKKKFLYWFGDGKLEFPDYTAMTVEDSLRRLTGQRTNWFLFRVFTDADDETLKDFLSSFEVSVNPLEDS